MSEARSLTAREAAELLGVSDRTIRRAILEGRLVATKSGRSFTIALIDLERYRSAQAGESASTEPSSLPSLVGREREIAMVLDLLRRPGTRVLTLAGPGGVGKTTLAHAVERSIAPDMPNGGLFVSLAGISSPDDVPVALTAAASIYVGQRSPAEAIDAWLDGKSLLLVLDNLEHVLGARTFIEELIQNHPNVIVLATSRERLGLSDESLFQVDPLRVEPAGTPVNDLRTASPAVRLFVQRVRDASPGFVPTPNDLTAFAEIAGRLDGLPLAIELAAARVDVAAPDASPEQLSARLANLANRSATVPDRHQTLTATIAWSYDLLSKEDQRMLRWISLLPAGISVDVARHIVAPTELLDGGFELDGDPEGPIPSVLGRLAQKHLLVHDGERRWSMLETTRAFAFDALVSSGERDAAMSHLVDIYEAMTLRHWEEGSTGRQVAWRRRLVEELENIRALLRWLSDRGDHAHIVRLVGRMVFFWQNRGLFREAVAWLQPAIAQLPDSSADRALLNFAIAYHLRSTGEVLLAAQYLEQSLLLLREWPDEKIEVLAREQLADQLQDEGRLDEADAQARRALAVGRASGQPTLEAMGLQVLGVNIALAGASADGRAMVLEAARMLEAAGDQRQLGRTLTNMGFLCIHAGALQEADEYYRRALVAYRTAEEQHAIGITLSNLADLALRHEDYALAAELAAEAAELSRQIGSTRHEAVARLNRAVALFRLGSHDEAYAGFDEATTILNRTGKTIIVGEALEVYGQLLVDGGLSLTGAIAFGAAHTIWKQTSAVVEPDRFVASNRAIASARKLVGNAAFDRAWMLGESASTEEAIRLIRLSVLAQGPSESAPSSSALSPREQAVLRLVAEGLSDREIGDVLFVSPRTVATHVAHILEKLGVESRTAAATKAVREGIV